MSVWSHVAAVFRIDAFRVDGFPLPNFENVFGKPCTYNSPDYVWDDCENHPEEYLPCGSEGSLEMSVWEDPDIHSLAAYTVTVFGDLRDYSDLKAIKKWFFDCCSKANIRQAVITAECENGKFFVERFVEKQ